MSGKRRGTSDRVTVLSADCALEGKLTARGPVQLDGAISGTLTAEGAVCVGSGARILGEVRADTLTVSGAIHGIVFVRSHLQVQASGSLRGYARYATLAVARGGVVDGSATQQVDAGTPGDDLREAAE